jgi:hypothetical protein
MKARHARDVKTLLDIPNVGPRISQDFTLIGIATPAALKGKDALTLYMQLCAKTGTRHDPCVLDTFMAVVDFMHGAPARVWWEYTPKRKRRYPNI